MNRTLLAFVMVAAMAGCAARSVPWQNPSLPKDQWGDDWSSCRRWAEDQVGWTEGASSQQFREYDRARAKRQANALASSCMRDRGYFPVRSN